MSHHSEKTKVGKTAKSAASNSSAKALKAVAGAYTKNETIAVHGGYEVDPTTIAVAIPIYQTVAYAFDSAEHGAALFNLETPGHRYGRISNPTNDVLEARVA